MNRLKTGVILLAVLFLPMAVRANDQRRASLGGSDLDEIREAVVRYILRYFEPHCRNYWDGRTYCLEFEDGKQPTTEFLSRMRCVAPGLRPVAECRQELGMQGFTTDPFIQILSISIGENDASADVVAFCGHGAPTLRRKAGRWTVIGLVGGWVGCGPVPVDCEHGDKAAFKERP